MMGKEERRVVLLRTIRQTMAGERNKRTDPGKLPALNKTRNRKGNLIEHLERY
jgi:hypothetical protein